FYSFRRYSGRFLTQQPSDVVTDFFLFIFDGSGGKTVFGRDNWEIRNIKPNFVFRLPIFKRIVVEQFILPWQILSSKLDVQPIDIRLDIALRNPMLTIP